MTFTGTFVGIKRASNVISTWRWLLALLLRHSVASCLRSYSKARSSFLIHHSHADRRRQIIITVAVDSACRNINRRSRTFREAIHLFRSRCINRVNRRELQACCMIHAWMCSAATALTSTILRRMSWKSSTACTISHNSFLSCSIHSSTSWTGSILFGVCGWKTIGLWASSGISCHRSSRPKVTPSRVSSEFSSMCITSAR